MIMIKPFQSETIGKIAGALRRAQAEYTPISKNRKAGNPGGKHWSYADLTQVLEAMLPILSKHELSFHQSEQYHDGVTLLFTQLSHDESGEWFGSYKPLLPKDQTDQAYGCTNSYQRRYAAYTLLAIFPSDEDDDGMTNAQKQKPLTQAEKSHLLELAKHKPLTTIRILKYRNIQSIDQLSPEHYDNTLSQYAKNEG